MPSLILPLPNDIESLQRLVREQHAELHSHALLIEKLKLELTRLKRWKFGRSSEQLDQRINQLELTLEELEATAPLEATPPHDALPAMVDRPVRRPLPSHLPRELIVHAPAAQGTSCACPACGDTLAAVSASPHLRTRRRRS